MVYNSSSIAQWGKVINLSANVNTKINLLITVKQILSATAIIENDSIQEEGNMTLYVNGFTTNYFYILKDWTKMATITPTYWITLCQA